MLLNGINYRILCNSLTTTARIIFESVVKSEQIEENYILGLCALIGGDFVFLPPSLKIYKVAPRIWKSSSFHSPVLSLYLRVKLFMPNLRILSVDSRHSLYLQLRKSIIENQISATEDDLIILGGLALQAEFGDFNEDVRKADKIVEISLNS